MSAGALVGAGGVSADGPLTIARRASRPIVCVVHRIGSRNYYTVRKQSLSTAICCHVRSDSSVIALAYSQRDVALNTWIAK